MTPKFVKARKPHRCTNCGRLIPVGTNYWCTYSEALGEEVDKREHGNCLDNENQPLLDMGFNQNRYKVEAK